MAILMRRRLITESASEEIDTSPVILQENVLYKQDGTISAKTGLCITKLYPFELDPTALRACADYNSANDYMNTNGSAFRIRSYTANPDSVSTSAANKHVIYDANDTKLWHASITAGSLGNFQSPRQSTALLNSGTMMYVGFSLFMASVDDAYAYFDSVTSSGVMPVGITAGDIIFAGRNTQYYGKRNIND